MTHAAARRFIALVVFSLATATVARAQRVDAVRIGGSDPHLDGRLDEAFWHRTAPATGFVQRDPDQGEPAPEATEVRFAYDGDALWIGARMFSADPGAIRAIVTRRDRDGISEEIAVSLDTHLDRRTAYTFAATPAGVRVDYFHPVDREGERDYGFDPVWDLATRVDSLGWTAEMRIPFSQLRFNPAVEQTWGVNIVRRIPSRNEETFWMLVRRDETGWSSRMGELGGLRDVHQTRRIEVVPYVAADATLAGEIDRHDPFASPRTTAARVGADLKLGLGPSLTLDAAVNPDFGQVEADPAEVNLSAYETFFDERRPFFAEGSPLLEGRGLFYSRRIGAPPPGESDADYAQQLDHTTILGAAKLSGRLPSRLSIAALGAVTGRETVATFDTASGDFGRDVVAPRSMYLVASAQQELGAEASTIAATFTAMRRDIAADSDLASRVSRGAYSGLLDGRIVWGEGEYDVSGFAGFADVEGNPEAILLLQRSSRRYWQRPDARRVLLDPTRRSLFGTMAGIGHSKMAGRHWRWDVDFTQRSPGFEPNDMGAFNFVDVRRLGARLEWNESEPSPLLRDYEIGIGHDAEWSFEGVRRERSFSPYVNFTLPNYWEVSVDGDFGLRAMSDRLTRGGPLMATPREWSVQLELQNGDGSRHRWGGEWEVGGDAIGGRSARLELNFTARPGTRWELRFDPQWESGSDPRQYVGRWAGGRDATYGQRHVFAFVDRREIATRIRVNFTATPDLTLESYIEPFASSGSYRRFGELLAPGSLDLLEYGSGGTTVEQEADGMMRVTADGSIFEIDPQDFNVRSFRSNVVLRWEWRAGSTLYAVWQQNREVERAPGVVRPGTVWDSLRIPGDHRFALKLSYWLPVP